MSLTEFHGLPTHVLLVHFVVVLVPLSALALVACALWPRAARRLGPVLPVLALVTLALVPFTTNAGEWLQNRVPNTPQINRHADLGAGMLPWVVAVVVMALAVWWLTRNENAAARPRTGEAHESAARRPTPRPPRTITAILALAAAVGAVVHVYRVGDSGSKAVWQGVLSQPTGRGRAHGTGRAPRPEQDRAMTAALIPRPASHPGPNHARTDRPGPPRRPG